MTSVAYALAFPATRGVLAYHPAGGGFNPTSLFSGDTGGWWDPSDMSTLYQDSAGTTPVTAVDQPVGRTDDKSGNGNHLLQATSSARPILRNSGSLWWLEFDGTNDFLRATFTFDQPFTRITAAQQVSWTLFDNLWDGAANQTRLYQSTSSPIVRMYAGTSDPASSDMTVGANHVVTEIFNSAGGATASKLAIDNNSYQTGDPGTNNPGGASIAIRADDANPARINWFGAIWIGRVLDSTEIANCRTYFGTKAGLSL
jgi:hypothetical protein